MIHLTPQQVSSFLDGELTEASTELVRHHLASCDECTLAFARAEEQAEQLARVLAHDPGAEYFAGFATAVEQLIRVGKVEPPPQARIAHVAPVVPAAPEPAPPPELEPRVEPSTLEYPASAPSPQPAEPVRSARRRESDRRPVPAIPWYAAAILVVIAGSVGVMVSRAPLLQRPSEAPPGAEPVVSKLESSEPSPVEPPEPERAMEAVTEQVNPDTEQVNAEADSEAPPASGAPFAAGETPAVQPQPAAPTPAERSPARVAARKTATEKTEPEPLVPEPMRTLMPVTRIVTVVETTQTARPASERPAAVRPSLLGRTTPAPRAEPDPFAALLAELQQRVAAARKATAHANEDPTAANYEGAAGAWEEVVSDLRGHAAQPRARFQLASARFRAWEMHPDALRAASAVASLRLHLVYAGPGAERDSSKAWMARLSH